MRELMAEYFEELDEAARTGSREDRLVHQRRPGRAAALVRFPGLLPGEPRRAARLLAHGGRSDPGGQRGRLLAGHLLLPDQRRRLVPEQDDPADQGLRHGDRCRSRTCWSTTPTSAATCRTGSASTSASSRCRCSASRRRAASTSSTRDDRRRPGRASTRPWSRPSRRSRAGASTSTGCARSWPRPTAAPCCGSKVLRLAEHRPSPITFFDGTIHMGPAVVLRGDERAERYYEILIAELEERIADGRRRGRRRDATASTGRACRCGASCARTRSSSPAHQACVVASTYCNSWIFEALACEDPFEGMARAYTELFIVRSEEFKEQYLEAMVRDYAHRRHHLPRRQDLPQQLQQPLRPAAAPPRAARHPVRGDQRRPQRPAPLLRGAGADPVRGAGGAARRSSPHSEKVGPAIRSTAASTSGPPPPSWSSSTQDREVRGRVHPAFGVDYAATARACLDEALDDAGRRGRAGSAAPSPPATGAATWTSPTTPAPRSTATASAATTTFRRAITIVDIGGQDNKVIRLDDSGRRVDFKMNRKCAAGTGAFLEEIALRLGHRRWRSWSGWPSSTDEAVRLNSFCTVFAKTEILAHLRRGEPLAGLVRGAFLSVVNRVAEMDPLDGEVVLTGGVVAHNPTIAEILAEQAGRAGGGARPTRSSRALSARRLTRARHRPRRTRCLTVSSNRGGSPSSARRQPLLHRPHRHQEPVDLRLQGADLPDQPQGRPHPQLQGLQVGARRAGRDRPGQHLGQATA